MELKKPTEKQINDYMESLVNKFKQDPQYELKQEFGKMLMKYINDLTPDEMKRYNELKEILKS